jgi:hypothetical protein
MTDAIIANAQAAAATPASGPPDAAIAAAQTKLNEMTGGRYAKTLEARAAAEAAPKPAAPDAQEQRRQEITKLLVTKQFKNDDEKAALTRELKQIVAGQETADEKAQRESKTLEERREEFGIKAPSRLHGHEVEAYVTDYGAWEGSLFDVARTEGLSGPVVGHLRDAAIDLGRVVGDRGTPATKEELDGVFNKLNVPAVSRPALAKLWKQLEGGAT